MTDPTIDQTTDPDYSNLSIDTQRIIGALHDSDTLTETQKRELSAIAARAERGLALLEQVEQHDGLAVAVIKATPEEAEALTDEQKGDEICGLLHDAIGYLKPSMGAALGAIEMFKLDATSTMAENKMSESLMQFAKEQESQAYTATKGEN